MRRDKEIRDQQGRSYVQFKGVSEKSKQIVKRKFTKKVIFFKMSRVEEHEFWFEMSH